MSPRLGRFDPFRGRRDSTPRSLDPPEGEPAGPPALIVGLRNPGKQYEDTRHNVGAWCIELLARRGGATFARQGGVDAATVLLDGRRLHLALPRSFMNVSGPPVAGELRRLGLTRDRLLVVYDELDLPSGQVRIRPHGGHGGHNGMRSVISAVGGNEFPRIRIGIDRPYDDGQPVRDPDRVADWVLSRPRGEERRLLEEAVARAADAIECAAREDIERAMSRYNPA